MTMAGKIIYGVGKLVGNTAGLGIEATGNVISSIAERAGKDKFAQSSKKYTQMASTVVGKTTKITAAVTAVLVDKTIDVAFNTAKYIAQNAVETNVRIYGDSHKFYDENKYIDVEYKVMEK